METGVGQGWLFKEDLAWTIARRSRLPSWQRATVEIHSDIQALPAIPHPVVTIGTFDGVHLGHRHIIDHLNTIAQEHGGESVLLTFHPHPRSVVQASAGIELLSTLEERLDLLAAAGLQHVVVYPFTMEFSRMSALEYVRDLLVNTIGVNDLVVGYDHHFGRNREGDIHLLLEYAELYGFRVQEIEAQMLDKVNISSTKIRQALHSGDVVQAKEYLGRHYSCHGTVVKGEGRGAGLGFPTANVVPDSADKLIPATGVYAVKVKVDGHESNGMLNIGHKPTFHASGSWPKSLEAHLFDYDADMYGKQVVIKFLNRVRDEVAFADGEALVKQLHEDRKTVLRLLT